MVGGWRPWNAGLSVMVPTQALTSWLPMLRSFAPDGTILVQGP